MGPGNRKPTYSIDELGNDTSSKAGGIITGLHNIPAGVVYGLGSGANVMSNVLGIRDDAEYQNAADSLGDFYDNPPYLSQEISDYRQHQQEENPNTVTAAEIVGSAAALPAKMVGRTVSKIARKLRPNNPMPVTVPYNQARALGVGTGAGIATGKELIVEPASDAMLNISR